MWRKGWMMKISEVKEREGRELGDRSDCEWSCGPHPNFMKRLRCVQCRWGVWLCEPEGDGCMT